jgi:hypothetical protein
MTNYKPLFKIEIIILINQKQSSTSITNGHDIYVMI